MAESTYWLKFAAATLFLGWIIYWSVRTARHPREVTRSSWWPLAYDQPTWPVIVPAWLGIAFALFCLALLIHAAVAGIR
jgi:hypothetical protein